MSAMNAEIALDNKKYASDVAHLNAEQKLGQITEQQKTAQVIEAVNLRMAAELKATDDALKQANLSVQQIQEIENKKTQIIRQAIADRQKAADQQSEAEVATAKRAADTIASAFNTQLQAVLQGHESFAQGMEKVFAAMVEMMIAKLLTLIAEYVVLNALAAATGGTGPTLMSLIMPQHADGMENVPFDHVAMVHKNEMIIPAGPAAALRSGLGGGAGGYWPTTQSFAQQSSSSTDNRQQTNNIHVHGADWSASTIRSNIRSIATELNSHWQSNPSTRPKGW